MGFLVLEYKVNKHLDTAYVACKGDTIDVIDGPLSKICELLD